MAAGILSRRLRARILRKEEPGPVTFGVWLRDLCKVVGTLLCLGVFVVILTAGTPLYRALSLQWFGYRPVGGLDDLIVLAFFVVAVPVSFLGFAWCMIVVMWTYRSMNWIATHLCIAVPIVCVAFFPVYWYFLGPQLNKRQHLNTWPAQLELASFGVCAVEVNEEPSQTTAPVGLITVDLVNRSDVAVSDAVFSVKAGSKWFHLSVQDLPAKARRRIEMEGDFGVTEKELSGDMSGWARRPGEIYWDHVRPREVLERKVARRPEIADVSPIPDCPRRDISGVWKSRDGAELVLSQRGSRPRGYVKGGPVDGEVSGSIEGDVFSGEFGHGSVRLRLVGQARLQGEWSAASRKGAWDFVRVGPGPAAPPRR